MAAKMISNEVGGACVLARALSFPSDPPVENSCQAPRRPDSP